MSRGISTALCAVMMTLVVARAHADIWLTHDGVLERRAPDGAVVTTIAEAFGTPFGDVAPGRGALFKKGEVDPTTGNIWIAQVAPDGPEQITQIRGVTPNGAEIWEHAEPRLVERGVFYLEPTFAIDTTRHGVWVLRAVDPNSPTDSPIPMEAVLYDLANHRLATVRGFNHAGFAVVAADGALWITTFNGWIRLQGTTEELDGYEIVGSTGPHHETFAGPDLWVAAADPSDGSVYFGESTWDGGTDTGTLEIVKLSPEGVELFRTAPYPTTQYESLSDIAVDPADHSVYFTTSYYGHRVVHLSPLGVELAGGSYGEHVGSVAVDPEDSTAWIAEMPIVDGDKALNAPMNLRKLDDALQTTVEVSFASPLSVIGAAPNAQTQLEISLSIEPSEKNPRVNLNGNGEVRVALLSGASFDPLQVDLDTVRFGTAGAVARAHWTRDVNRDGLADLVLQFRTGDTGIKCGDTAAPLTAATYDGMAVHGAGQLRTLCRDDDCRGLSDRSTSARIPQRLGVFSRDEHAYR